MAKNTGRGSRIAAASPTSRQFIAAKQRGGDFSREPGRRRTVRVILRNIWWRVTRRA